MPRVTWPALGRTGGGNRVPSWDGREKGVNGREIAPATAEGYAGARVMDRPGGRAGGRKLAEGIWVFPAFAGTGNPKLPPQL